ncbi:hypothetical protein QTH90_28945 [Variovorax sp. J2P1-59]|uniref:hypothetical protein n=1 Tax=Variovorax flavidus TaxID=3053501 RepID=UPI002577D6EC|nr:hypothetical protein [Variovorax sp. J2P1-59]MDM0078466.1 hypothetical protein [Variovorax sp. J2P1-59]
MISSIGRIVMRPLLERGHGSVIYASQNDRPGKQSFMHRTHCSTRIGLTLLALSASTWVNGAELDFNLLEVPAETQSSGPAQPQAWTPMRPSPSSPDAQTLPKPQQREEAAGPGSAVLTPFAESSRAPSGSAAPHDKAAAASRGLDVPDLVLTAVAILAGVAALAWLLRRA